MTKHKKQHFVPSSYLEAWCDPQTPLDQTPYVWRISKEGTQLVKKAPKKIFYETDMYTIETPEGGRDLILEHNLSRVEDKFVRIRVQKLDRIRQLDREDHFHLCMFVAAMFARTKAYAKHQSSQWQKVVDMAEQIQSTMENASPEEREQMSKVLSSPHLDIEESFTVEDAKDFAANPIQSFLSTNVTTLTPLLFKIPYLILKAPKDNKFITSDNPCVWFDPRVFQNPRPFGAGGLVSPTLEISMPISPRLTILFGGKLIVTGTYFPIDDEMTDNINKRTRLSSDKFVISNSNKINPSWF